MKLSVKLMSFIFAGIIVLLTIDGYLSFHREIALFDHDMERDARFLGRAMKELVSHAWEAGGME